MDLPPPPPLFRHHLRYGNVLHPLPPLPPPTPFPQIPPPQQTSFNPSFNFSPPPHPILERYNNTYELDRPPKPFFDREFEFLPPPPPPPIREDVPLRHIRGYYPERNSFLEREMFARRGFSDNSFVHELPSDWDRDLRRREVRSRVSDMGDRERYRDVWYRSGESCSRRDDAERRWDDGGNEWGLDLYNERGCDDRRWGAGVKYEGRELYNERGYDDRRWESGLNNRGCDLYNERAYDERRLDSVVNDRCMELYTDGGDDERGDYCSNDGVFLTYGNRHDLRLGRFSGRLGRGVGKEEFMWSKKKENKSKKKNALRRIQFRKDFSRDNGDYKWQQFTKESGSGSSREKKEEAFERSQTEMEGEREREQSPLELAISFKSNALVAKAILVPSPTAIKSDVNSTFVNNRAVCSTSDSPLAKSSENVAKTVTLTHCPDLRSDSQGSLNELQDNAVVSGSRSVTAHDAKSVGENAVKNEPLKEMAFRVPTVTGSGRKRMSKSERKRRKKLLLEADSHLNELQDNTVVSGSGSVTAHDAKSLDENAVKNEPLKDMALGVPTVTGNGRKRISKSRKKRRKQLLLGANLQKEDHNSIISGVQQLNRTSQSEGIISSAFNGVVPDTSLLPALGVIVPEKGSSSGDFDKSFVPNLKRKWSSSTSLSPSSYVSDNVINGCTDHGEGLVTTTKDADRMCQLRADKVTCHAHKEVLPGESIGQGDDGSCSNQHASNADKIVYEGVSMLGTENIAHQCTRLGTDMVDDVDTHPFQEGSVTLTKSFVKGPSKVMVSIAGNDITGLSGMNETGILELEEYQYISKIRRSDSSSVSESASQRPGNVMTHCVGSAEANSNEFFLAQVNIPRVGVDAEELRNSEGEDCSHIRLDNSTSSDFLSADHKGIISQSKVSFLDDLSKKSFIDEVGSVGKSPKAVSNVKPGVSIDYSPKIIRKRKTRDSQTCVSVSNNGVLDGTPRPIGGKVARTLVKDLVPAVEVDFFAEKDCKEDDTLDRGASGAEDTTGDIDFGANGSFTGFRKKMKTDSPMSNLSSLLEDDTVADGLVTDCSDLDQKFTRLAEWAAEQRDDTPPASTDISRRSTSDVEVKVGGENFYVADLDENLAVGSELHVNDDSADQNGICDSNSGDEVLASDFDMRSCSSSPEELLSYSDFSFSGNTTTSFHQSENEMICGADNMSNGKLVSADLNTFSIEKPVEEAASSSQQTNHGLPPSLPEENSQVVKKLNLVHGKPIMSKNQLNPAVPKVFPAHLTSNFSNSRKFHSTHVTQSRTWHRPVNYSIAVAEPKLQPSPIPQSNGAKTARTTQNTYIRKGNSLVRNPSVTQVGFNGSRSSVYRLTPCTDNLKKNKVTDSKTGDADADAPTLPMIEKVNTSEMHKALTLNHSGKSSNVTVWNLKPSLPVGNPPRNSYPCKTSDALEESVKSSSAVPEFRTNSGNNSDCQSTLEGGSLEKKIMYVKRRSNQLVATSNSDDTSAIGVDKTQASLSDGYYKSRKNQLVRASSPNDVGNGDASLNSHRLVSQNILPITSSRRQSSFAKSYKYSKVSFVWKLDDKQSSEKHKNSLGPRKVWPYLLPWKRAAHWRSFVHALGTKPNKSSFSTVSQKLLLSRKRGAIYTRSTHGYSLRMSKILSIGGSSLKWSKSIDKNSKRANEEATRAVAAAEKRKNEAKSAVPIASKGRNHIFRKLVLSVKLRPGERVFRIGSERYKMDPTRRTLHRIAVEEEPSSSVLQSEKNVKRSYVPRRLLIGNEEYVRIGNGNQLVRDPKKRTRVLASEKVRWSLRTARLRLARKKKYCQFFTRFGKCNKDDGKCPYIHDPSKIAVCTKFLSGACSNPDCKLTHKVIPERMQDCSYFQKGSCFNENCPYRHVDAKPDWTVCKSFLRGYCADGNECQKRHTYVCPAFEATGSCPEESSTCKLHHPKKKTEKNLTTEQKIVRGRYFDGGLVGLSDCNITTTENLAAKGKGDIRFHEGSYPDYISLDVSDDEADPTLTSDRICDDFLPDAEIENLDENRLEIVL